MLILRDAFAGMTRFDEFQKSLGIAPNMLTRRLAALVEAGMLERRRYSEHPPRDEYLLTERGRDFRRVLLALLAFGNRHFAPEGASVSHRRCRRPARRPSRCSSIAPTRPAARRPPTFASSRGPAASDGKSSLLKSGDAAPAPDRVARKRAPKERRAMNAAVATLPLQPSPPLRQHRRRCRRP